MPEKNLGDNEHLILYDGVCNLCNRLLLFIVRHDKKRIFRYASLQSKFAQNYLKDVHKEISMDTIVYSKNKKVYTKSTAILRLLKELGGIYSLAFVFIIVPRFLRDPIYFLIARYRHKLFTKKISCRVASVDETLFLD